MQSQEFAQEIILELEGEIELMETGAEYAYDWNTMLYVIPTTYDIQVEHKPPPEELRDIKEMLKTKVVDRLYRLENGLALDLDEISIGNMVIVDHGEIDEHGFLFLLLVLTTSLINQAKKNLAKFEFVTTQFTTREAKTNKKLATLPNC